MSNPMDKSLKANQLWLEKNVFATSHDVKHTIKSLIINGRQTEVMFVYADIQTDVSQFMQTFIPALEEYAKGQKITSLEQLRTQIKIPDLTVQSEWSKITRFLFTGHALVIIDGFNEMLAVNELQPTIRSPEEPPVETSILGPRDGFIESAVHNVAIMRDRLPTEDLACEYYYIGRRSQTQVVLAYMRDIADAKIVQLVRERINKVDIDILLGLNHLNELIADKGFTIFPRFDYTQRPDKCVASLAEGRIAIIVDGTPMATIAPVTLIQLMQAADDYQNTYFFASAMRIGRILAMFVSLYLPAVYVATTEYHQDTLPVFLLLSLVNSHRGVALPTSMEAIIMLILLEMFREAGLRLPRTAGQTIGILGTVVVGDAAIRAGIAGASLILIIGITAVSTFAVPNYHLANAISLLRIGIVVVAAIFGFTGIIMSYIMIIAHWCALRPFGVPYLAPFSPFMKKDLKDSLIRQNMTAFTTRPSLLRTQNKTRKS